jgi:hypothetical protein
MLGGDKGESIDGSNVGEGVGGCPFSFSRRRSVDGLAFPSDFSLLSREVQSQMTAVIWNRE